MILRFGDCHLDLERRELVRGGDLVHVEPQVFDLLALLIAGRERVVSKDEILETVWRGRIVSEATLSSRINAARRAIGDDGKGQTLIRTVPRRGFRFVGAIRSAPEIGTPFSGSGSEVPEVNQKVTFCTTPDGVRLAVATTGKGAVLVKTANWLNHLEYDWRSPVWAPSFAGLTSRRQLVRYDERGTGLSDWDVADISFEAFVSDLETVVDAGDLRRFDLFGMSQGGAVALAYAARHPERVAKLVIHGAFGLGQTARKTQADDDQATAFLTLIRQGWGYPQSAFLQAFSSLYLPDATPEQVGWFTDLQRATVSPENAVRIRQACNEIDILDLLHKIEAPTLVTHCRGDNVVPFSHGRMIASSIPGARFVELDSANHLVLPFTPVWNRFMAEVESFLSTPGAG